MLKRTDLHPYQVKVIEQMKGCNEAAVWMGLGDGKTAIALTMIADVKRPTIVFGTKRIIEYTWPAEIEKWEHLQGLKYVAASGTRLQRIRAVESKPDILGVSYDNLAWFYENASPYLIREYVFAIFDEISKMKDPSTKRSKVFRKARRTYHPGIYGLTATPATESYLGLFGQYRVIATQPILGKTLTEFREQYTTQQFKGMFTEYTIGPLQKRAIETAIAPYTITIPESDRPKRPEPTVVDIAVPWENKKNHKLYQQMEKKLIIELEEHKAPFQAASKGVAFNKCRQLACGFMYVAEGEPSEFDPSKLDAVAEAYEELQGEPVLVLYQFVWEKEALLRRLKGSEPLEGDAYQRFNAGEVPALIVHPKSCGHGLNLQGSCRHVFWSSLPWSLEDYLQSNGRIDRQGQDKQVVITRFMREDSIDQDISARLAGKVVDMHELIERMRGREKHG